MTQLSRLLVICFAKLMILTALLAGCGPSEKQSSISYLKINGVTMGVVPYQVTYGTMDKVNLVAPIDSVLDALNHSLSTYVATSEISELNQQNELRYRSGYFLPMLKASKEVFQITSGAFDPTVGPLVNLWGFGPGKENILPDSAAIDAAMQKVGFGNVQFDDQVVQTKPGQYLDFSAIAKGYAVDLVAELLISRGIENFYVEIGGEVRCGGKNPEQKVWRIGIYDPRVSDDPTKEIAAIVAVDDKAIATSGNYRNFYIKNGKKYAHTISPFTGYPVQHSLLSASVFANNCTLADAYATAFMVMGLEQAVQLVEANPQIDAHLIYADENGDLQSYTSQGIQDVMNVPEASGTDLK